MSSFAPVVAKGLIWLYFDDTQLTKTKLKQL